MKGLKNKITNSLTGRDLKTVLHPKTTVENEVTIATERGFSLHSYILDVKNLDFTPSNTIIAKLPKKSNIKDIVPLLDKIKKEIKGDKLMSKGDDYVKVTWVDRFNRFLSGKVETPDAITTVIRGDIVQWLFLNGKVLVQCTTTTCDALLPSILSVKLNQFVPRDPTKE